PVEGGQDSRDDEGDSQLVQEERREDQEEDSLEVWKKEEEQDQPPAELRNQAGRGRGLRRQRGDSPGRHQRNPQALREGKRSGRRIQGEDELVVVRGGAAAGGVQGGAQGRTGHAS